MIAMHAVEHDCCACCGAQCCACAIQLRIPEVHSRKLCLQTALHPAASAQAKYKPNLQAVVAGLDGRDVGAHVPQLLIEHVQALVQIID